MNIPLEQIKALAELAQDKQLAEVTVTDGDKTITIKTPASVAQPVAYSAPAPAPSVAVAAAVAPVAASSASAAPAAAVPADAGGNYVFVKAPMVGTFYGAPSPDSPAFVEKGQVVKVGQTLCILEAMKQMNELESDVAGTLVEVLVANGQSVEFGQPLFKLQA
jgi:acetyl-CoA carboxylase biotin carboxyl carrier protein